MLTGYSIKPAMFFYLKNGNYYLGLLVFHHFLIPLAPLLQSGELELLCDRRVFPTLAKGG